MGIDIYLNGYEAYRDRTCAEKKAFDDAVRIRDSFSQDSKEHKEAQELVEKAAGAMWSPRKGYLRSSYNSAGLFNGLEEILGVDVAALLFPGSWEGNVPIDVAEFRRIVVALVEAALTLNAGTPLPIVAIVESKLGHAIPDPHESRTSGEAFGMMVRGLVSNAGFGDRIEPPDKQPDRTFDPRKHGWYVRQGLLELAAFADCARKLRDKGESVFAYVSY